MQSDFSSDYRPVVRDWPKVGTVLRRTKPWHGIAVDRHDRVAPPGTVVWVANTDRIGAVNFAELLTASGEKIRCAYAPEHWDIVDASPSK